VAPKTVLDAVVKRKIPSPRRESNPRTPIVQFVAQRHIDHMEEETKESYTMFGPDFGVHYLMKAEYLMCQDIVLDK
jgi:hypothetical protein